MDMKFQIIFIVIALLLTGGAVGLFVWRLLSGADDPTREWRRIDENVSGLRYEYERAKELLAGGRISKAEFEERENELALRVIDETAQEDRGQDRASQSLPAITAAAVGVFMFATSAGLYLYYGDYSALDEKAIEQVRLTQQQAAAELNLADTVETLEKSLEKNKDNLEAWEILADRYNSTGNLSQAQIAYENVVRLNPKAANAYAELADVLIAIGDGHISDKVAEYAKKCLEIDPYHQKGLMIGAAAAFEKADYAGAAILFNRLRSQIPSGNEVHDALSQQIDIALQMGGLDKVPQDPVPPKPESDIDKMMKLGMPAAPEAGADGVGLLPKRQ